MDRRYADEDVYLTVEIFSDEQRDYWILVCYIPVNISTWSDNLSQRTISEYIFNNYKDISNKSHGYWANIMNSESASAR